jgi:hypothetical protein
LARFLNIIVLTMLWKKDGDLERRFCLNGTEPKRTDAVPRCLEDETVVGWKYLIL